MLGYIEFANQFWKENCRKRFLPREVSLYFFLLHECNRNYWTMPFICSTEYVCSQLQISKQSLYVARDNLAQRGLVSFNGGKWGSQSPSYSLLSLNDDPYDSIRERTTEHTNDSTSKMTTMQTNDRPKERTREGTRDGTIIKEETRRNNNNNNVVSSSREMHNNDYLQKYRNIEGKWK